MGRGGADAADVREPLRASAAACALRAPRRTAHLRHHASCRDGPAIGARCCASCSPAAIARSARTIMSGKHRHARLDDVRRHAYASTLPRQQFEDQLTVLTARNRIRGRRPSGVLPIRTIWILCRPRRGARAARLPRRIERRTALLRSAQRRTGVRRSAATPVLPGVRQRDPKAGIEQPARSPGELRV